MLFELHTYTHTIVTTLTLFEFLFENETNTAPGIAVRQKAVTVTSSNYTSDHGLLKFSKEHVESDKELSKKNLVLKHKRSKQFRSLTIEEVEKCMGFTSMYVGKFFDQTDSGKRNAWALLGQSFSVQVVSRLLAPLRTMYKVKQYKEYTNKPFPGEKGFWH